MLLHQVAEKIRSTSSEARTSFSKIFVDRSITDEASDHLDSRQRLSPLQAVAVIESLDHNQNFLRIY